MTSTDLTCLVPAKTKNHTDYTLSFLGIRIKDGSCQLIARTQNGEEHEWYPLGQPKSLPIMLPDTPDKFGHAADALRTIAFQYQNKYPESNLLKALRGQTA